MVELAGKKGAILVVDDRESNLCVLRMLLGDIGLDLVTADSGAAALRCLLAREFDLILLDLRLPVMDGFALAALIRERERSRRTPILFLTAYGPCEIPPFPGREAAPVELLEKPVDGPVLRARVLALAAAG